MIKPELPAEARRPCAKPSTLPAKGGLSQAEVVSLWGADRSALNVCETRRAAAVAAVDSATGETTDGD
ncbi:hypothetical protein TM49_13690 [Martelella endophytica]|uniref:Uncharacterized protein n=2 Tax=Martelella endophytica TaxID=1486262 RepID=A0A0D5LT06_MAREN|nr:hypothetical protein TM49_13690 [Martelella endophytica]